MPDPILVGVDGSSTAQRAALRARDLALALDAPLYIVTAHTHDEIVHVRSGADRWVFSDEKEAHRVAEKVVATLSVSGLKICPVTVHGKPSDALIEYADKVNAQMIVVGNQRMRGITRVLGSVANAISHNANCDVYIVNTYD